MIPLGPIVSAVLGWLGRMLARAGALLVAYHTGRRTERQRQALEVERRAKEAYRWKAEHPVDARGDPRGDFGVRDPGARISRDPSVPPRDPGAPDD